MNRRFEVLDKDISLEERKNIVNHYTKQLVNSGYSALQIKEIIESALKGVVRKQEKKNIEKYRYRSSEDTIEERERKKLTEATNWYKKNEKKEEQAGAELGQAQP